MPSPVLPPLSRDDLEHAFSVVGESRWKSMSGRRIFFTGGTGFVGKWMIASLLEADKIMGLGCEIVVLSRSPEAFAAECPNLAGAASLTLQKGDIMQFRAPLAGCDIVVHAATDVVKQNSARATFEACYQGTQNVLDRANESGVNKILLISSGAVYGRQPPDLERVPETYAGAPNQLLPSSAYGEGKRVSEWLLSELMSRSDLQGTIARCFAFVGPYLPLDKHYAIGNFIRDALLGRNITINSDGTALRSYLYAADMAAWLWAILISGEAGQAYNVGGEEAISIGDLAKRVAKISGSGSNYALGSQTPPSSAPERYVPDTALVRKRLALIDPISLDKSIERTLRWHRDNSRIK